jgi:serine/threonine protein kinase
MHRDLKPENIMLRSPFSMDPVIVDFGLATNADV